MFVYTAEHLVTLLNTWLHSLYKECGRNHVKIMTCLPLAPYHRGHRYLTCRWHITKMFYVILLP